MFKSLFCNLHEEATKYERINQFQRGRGGAVLALNARSPFLRRGDEINIKKKR